MTDRHGAVVPATEADIARTGQSPLTFVTTDDAGVCDPETGICVVPQR